MRYPYTTIRKTKIFYKTDTTKYWQGYGATRTCLHCWQEYEMVQPFWERTWQFLTKLNVCFPMTQKSYTQVFTQEKDVYIFENTCTRMLITTL